MKHELKLPEHSANASIEHPEYTKMKKDWDRVRDCVQSESHIKSKGEKYLPRPAGMSGEYADAYDAYKERAHYPQICSYALQGALGVIITKLPEFNLPTELKHLLKNATKDGVSLNQLFLDTLIEILQTGRCPLLVDIVPETNQFKFVQYKAEDLINWRESMIYEESSLILAVLKEQVPSQSDIFSHDTENQYRVLYLDKAGNYSTTVYAENGHQVTGAIIPKYMGRKLNVVPIYNAGSINNNIRVQPIPLLSVANCSIQIYRKEADLANAEFITCNPTLCMVGASNDDDLPNVVGSSVMIVLPEPQARVFYTETDTAALTHVKDHIVDLYDEAIRHGVAILDARKGVEAAEALRIRQATQSASIYSMYLSALNAITQGLETMCVWAGIDPSLVRVDAPSSLTYGIPDSTVIREVVAGFGMGVVPISVVHRYLVGNGLVDQTVNLDDFKAELAQDKSLREMLMPKETEKPGEQHGRLEAGKKTISPTKPSDPPKTPAKKKQSAYQKQKPKRGK